MTLLLAVLITACQAQTETDSTRAEKADFEQRAFEPKDEIWVLDLWASWCGPCIRAIPHLKVLNERYKDQKVKIFSLSLDDNENAWKKALAKYNMPWTQFRYAGRMSWPNQHIRFSAIPTIVVIDKAGKFKTYNDVYRAEDRIRKLLKKQQ